MTKCEHQKACRNFTKDSKICEEKSELCAYKKNWGVPDQVTGETKEFPESDYQTSPDTFHAQYEKEAKKGYDKE